MKQLKVLLLASMVMFFTACRDDSSVGSNYPTGGISSIEQVPSVEDNSSVVKPPQTNSDADPNEKVSQTIRENNENCEETTPCDEEKKDPTSPSNTAQWDSSNWDELIWQ